MKPPRPNLSKELRTDILAGMKPTSYAKFPAAPHAQSDEAALIRQIIADPRNALPRAVFADWLEDAGRGDEAAWWRAEYEKAWAPWIFWPTNTMVAARYGQANQTTVRSGRLEGRFPPELIAHFMPGQELVGLAAEGQRLGIYDVPVAVVECARLGWPNELSGMSPTFDDDETRDLPHWLVVSALTKGPFTLHPFGHPAAPGYARRTSAPAQPPRA